MIKSAPIEALQSMNYHFITALTKPQIAHRIQEGVLQVELFEDTLCEVAYEGCRLIVRRNPLRAQEMAQSRVDKLRCIEAFLEQRNVYLQKHPRVKMEVTMSAVQKKMNTLKVSPWLRNLRWTIAS